MELDSVRAGIVNGPKDYRWSSYWAYGYGKKDPLIEENSIYHELFDEEINRRKRYREFVEERLRMKGAMGGEKSR